MTPPTLPCCYIYKHTSHNVFAAVAVALCEGSDPSVQLKAGMVVELMDYIINNQSVRRDLSY